MPDQKISQLASGTNAQTGDLFVIARSGANYSLTTAQLFAPAQSANSATGLFLVNSDTGSSATARVTFSTQGGNAYIEARRNAGGSLVFNIGAADRWVMNNSGHFLASADNTSDIGASGANRPRDLFLGRNLFLATGSNISVPDNFVLYDSTSAITRFGFSTNNTYNTRTGGSHIFQVAGTERMRIDSGGVVSVGAAALSASNSYGTPQLGVASDSLGTFHVETHNNAPSEYSFLGLMKSRGTRAAPTHVQSGDNIGAITAQVYNDAGSFPYRGSAAIQFLAAANHTVGSLPTAITFATTPSGGLNYSERMRIDAAGNVGIGTTAPIALLHVAGQVHVQPSTASNALITFRHGSLSVSNYIEGRSNSSTIFGTANADRMTLDASGNLGLGVTPSAWLGTSKAFTVLGATLSRDDSVNARLTLTNNAFRNSSSAWTYIGNGGAAAYEQFFSGGGGHAWYTAPSGTAGNAITFTQAMTLSAAGNLTIGGTNDSARLRVEGTTNLTAGMQLFRSGNICGAIWAESSALRFGIDGSTGFTERWQINSSGHLLAGADNSYDIGASGATRPRDLFVGRNVVAAGQGNFGNLVLGTVSASLSNVSTGMVGYADSHPSFGNGTLVLQARSSVARPIVFVTGATTGTARMSVKEDGQVRYVPLAAAPTTNVEDGDVYYDSGTNKLRVRAGGAWVDLH